MFLFFLLYILQTNAVHIDKCKYISYTETQHKIEIVKKLPHEKFCYTQGLYINDTVLYESCGMYNQSAISMYEWPSLKLMKSRSVPDKQFAEGIAIVNETLVMLTWKENIMHLINPKSMQFNYEVKYPFKGWGAANDDHDNLYVTDGTNKIRQIRILHNSEIEVIKEWGLRRGKHPVSKLNEIEIIGNLMYINIYWEDKIFVVNMDNMSVVGEIWCNVKREGNEEVMNGIARIDDSTLLITGKYWDSMFELKIK